jgi:hypothetical protein
MFQHNLSREILMYWRGLLHKKITLWSEDSLHFLAIMKNKNKNLELDLKPPLKPQRNWVKNWLKSIIVDVASHFISDFFMAKFSLFCES